jgi:predicted nicotinamide N-methyase
MFRFGERSLTIERPVDAEALIDESRFAQDEFLPYWAEVWPCGVALADHVATLDLRGRTVLELGCGLGLPSLVAAGSGADVLATDWAVAALESLAANARRNGLTLAVDVVDWFRPPPPGARMFDLVLAADVLYEERNRRPVLAQLSGALAPGGQALVCDPGRRHAAAFPEAARQTGFGVEHTRCERLPNGGIWRLWRTRHEVGTIRS